MDRRSKSPDDPDILHASARGANQRGQAVGYPLVVAQLVAGMCTADALLKPH